MEETLDLGRILRDLWQSVGGFNLILIPITGALFLGSLKRFLPVVGRVRNVLMYLACLLLSGINVHIGLGEETMFLTVPIFVGLVLVLWRGPALARISMALIFFTIAVSSSALFNLLIPPNLTWLFNATATLLWLVVYLFLRRGMPLPGSGLFRSVRTWLLVDALALMPFGSTFLIVMFTQRIPLSDDPRQHLTEYVIPNEPVIVGVLCFVLVSILALLVAVVVLTRHEQLQQEQMLWMVNRQHYDSMEQAQHQVRRLRHDMANHLAVMSGMEGEALHSYLDQLMDTPAFTTGRVYCQNRVVNAVLGGKLAAAEEAGIKTQLDVALPQSLPLQDIELCAMYANCLDNAIEASAKLPREQRFLALRSYADRGLLTLHLENRMAGQLNMKDGVIVTGKANPREHGFGLAGLREMARRYGGTVEAGQQGDSFHLMLTIPLAAPG